MKRDATTFSVGRSSKRLSIMLALLALVFQASGQAVDPQPTGEDWADCAAAMTQRALIREELEKRSADTLYAAIGRYYLLSCAYSSPVAADASYARARAAQAAAFQEAAGRCRTEPNCISAFVSRLEGQLLVCAGQQKKSSDEIATRLQRVNPGCQIEIRRD